MCKVALVNSGNYNVTVIISHIPPKRLIVALVLLLLLLPFLYIYIFLLVFQLLTIVHSGKPLLWDVK